MSAPTARSAASQDSVSSPELTGGGVLQQVAPVYPVDAREQRLQGDVLLSVVIGEDGSVRDVQPLSGPAPLFPAAVEAVRQWRYEPFRLNGAPVSKPTTITIHFALP